MGTSFIYTHISYTCLQENCQHSISMDHLIKRLLPISQLNKNVCNLRTQLNVYLYMYEYFVNPIARPNVFANALWNRFLFSLVSNCLSSYLRNTFGRFVIKKYTYMYIWIKGNQNWWKRKFYFTRKKNHKNQTIFLTKIIIENIESHLEYMYIALSCNFIMRALLCLLSFKSPYTYFKLSATPIVLGTFSYYWMNIDWVERNW